MSQENAKFFSIAGAVVFWLLIIVGYAAEMPDLIDAALHLVGPCWVAGYYFRNSNADYIDRSHGLLVLAALIILLMPVHFYQRMLSLSQHRDVKVICSIEQVALSKEGAAVCRAAGIDIDDIKMNLGQ